MEAGVAVTVLGIQAQPVAPRNSGAQLVTVMVLAAWEFKFQIWIQKLPDYQAMLLVWAPPPITCAFTATVQDSSIGEWAHFHQLWLALIAFHGYAHGCAYMLKCHPLYLLGFELEDFETCKCVFSASNSVAHLVWHASHFHYLQFIDLHFQQWDDDKYPDLSKLNTFMLVRSLY